MKLSRYFPIKAGKLQFERERGDKD